MKKMMMIMMSWKKHPDSDKQKRKDLKDSSSAASLGRKADCTSGITSNKSVPSVHGVLATPLTSAERFMLVPVPDPLIPLHHCCVPLLCLSLRLSACHCSSVPISSLLHFLVISFGRLLIIPLHLLSRRTPYQHDRPN